MSDQQPDRTYRGDENQQWYCDNCDWNVRVLTSDPYYPEEVICPKCKCPTEFQA